MTLPWALRHLAAIGLLPFTAAVLIPLWLARRGGTIPALGGSVLTVVAQTVGLGLIAAGALLFFSTLRRFAGEGHGTLAPWDPPRRLVVRGPYRYVRNPMISGVMLVLFGEALILGSRAHFIWALVFVAINAVYIPLIEEPMLVKRFRGEYEEYRRHVPRFVPRLRPWITADPLGR